MTATWTTPRTYVSGELITSAVLNSHIRDNMDWLKTPLESGKITFAALFSTTSATFVDITGVTTTITTLGGGLDVIIRLTAATSALGTTNGFQLVVDGVSEAILGQYTQYVANYGILVSFCHHIAALAAGSHTIKVQCKVSGGATLSINGTTAAVGDPLFYVVERGS